MTGSAGNWNSGEGGYKREEWKKGRKAIDVFMNAWRTDRIPVCAPIFSGKTL
jgi:hypothetical protein